MRVRLANNAVKLTPRKYRARLSLLAITSEVLQLPRIIYIFPNPAKREAASIDNKADIDDISPNSPSSIFNHASQFSSYTAKAQDEAAMATGAPKSLSFPLPRGPETRIHMRLTNNPTCILLFLTTSQNGDTSSPAALGSFVYALPDVGLPFSFLELSIRRAEIVGCR